MPTNDDEQMEIEELAKLMWASWGGSNYGEPWEKLDEPYKLKWRSQAELIIDNGYRKQSPESSKLILLDKKEIWELTKDIPDAEDYELRTDNGDYTPDDEEKMLMEDYLNGYLEEFVNLICCKFGSPFIPSVEYILDLIESPMITPSKYGPVWWVSKGKKELAEAIHRLLTNGK